MTRIRLSVAAVAVAVFASGLSAQQTAQSVQEDEFLKDAYPANTPDLVAPEVILKVIPKYTSEGLRARIQGTVGVQVVVNEDGMVLRARVTKSLDKAFGLAESAIRAAKSWMFKPGKLKGRAVVVAIPITLEFRF